MKSQVGYEDLDRLEGKLEKPSLILDKLRELLIKSLNQDNNKEDSKEGMDMAHAPCN